MSKPRAAKSVAIKTLYTPPRNFMRFFSRSICSIPPWKMPCSRLFLAKTVLIRSTASRWLQKMRQTSCSKPATKRIKVSAFSVISERTIFSWRREILIFSWKFIVSADSKGRNLGSVLIFVAEVKMCCCWPFKSLKITSICGWKPNCNDLSNSSSTIIETFEMSIVFRIKWSAKRPGVPMTTVGASSRLFCSVLKSCPP